MSTPAAIFRPRLTGLAMSALLLTLAAYAGLRLLAPEGTLLAERPFGLAALLGLLTFGSSVATRYLRTGIRADETGLCVLPDGAPLRWSEIESIRVEVMPLQHRERPMVARVAVVEGRGITVRFGDLGPGLPWELGGVHNLDGAGLLLATIAARTGSEALFPEGWTRDGGASPSTESETDGGTEPRSRGLGRRTPWSFIALLIKVVPKFGAVALKLLKTIKPAAALVTVGAYSLIVSWKFAIAFVLMIGVHECGHVYAMWRSGVRVKGIYFVPFFGGAAVSEGPASTAARSAYIAINGPVWGSALALACLVIYWVGGESWAFVGALAAWGALINLFNLLPIMPLDGGRILAAVGASRAWGVPLVFASLLLGAALAYFAELELLVLMVGLGLMELGGTIRHAQSGPSLALVKPHSLGAVEHEHFASMVAPVSLGRGTEPRVRARAEQFEHYAAVARQTPMSAAQIAVAGLGYVALSVALLAMMWSLRDLSGAGNPMQFLR